MIQLDQVTVVRNGHVQLPSVSATFSTGKMYAVIGPSGIGKSTLLRIIAGIEKPTSGEVRYSDAPYVNMVFQTVNLWPHLRIQRQLDIVHQRLPTSVREDLAKQRGLAGLLKRFPNELSQGQRQRAALLRCLITDPDVLLADEVTSAQDVEYSKIIMGCFREFLLTAGKSVIAISHDHALMEDWSDEIIALGQTGTSSKQIIKSHE